MIYPKRNIFEKRYNQQEVYPKKDIIKKKYISKRIYPAEIKYIIYWQQIINLIKDNDNDFRCTKIEIHSENLEVISFEEFLKWSC